MMKAKESVGTEERVRFMSRYLSIFIALLDRYDLSKSALLRIVKTARDAPDRPELFLEKAINYRLLEKLPDNTFTMHKFVREFLTAMESNRSLHEEEDIQNLFDLINDKIRRIREKLDESTNPNDFKGPLQIIREEINEIYKKVEETRREAEYRIEEFKQTSLNNVQEAIEEIRTLRNEYVRPIIDIIDPEGPSQEQFDRINQTLYELRDRDNLEFPPKFQTPPKIVQEKLSIIRENLLKNAKSVEEQASTLLMNLHEKNRQHKGVSRIIQNAQDGEDPVRDLPEIISIPRANTGSSLINRSTLVNELKELADRSHRKDRTLKKQNQPDNELPAYIQNEQSMERLRQIVRNHNGGISDFVSFVVDRLDKPHPNQVINLVLWAIQEADETKICRSSDRSDYTFNGYRISMRSLKLREEALS